MILKFVFYVLLILKNIFACFLIIFLRNKNRNIFQKKGKIILSIVSSIDFVINFELIFFVEEKEDHRDDY